MERGEELQIMEMGVPDGAGELALPPTPIRKKTGGKLPGAGRPRKTITRDVRAVFEAAAKKDKGIIERILKDILKKAEEGDIDNRRFFMTYFFGKPTEYIEVTNKQLIITRTIIDERR